MAVEWSIAPAATTTLDQLILGELARLLREPRAPRLALELGEAAAALGVSPKFLTEHIRPELRLIRRGRKVLVPVAELRRWVDENAAFTVERQS